VLFKNRGWKVGSPLRKVLLAALALVALTPAGAQAFALQEVGGLNSPAAGIALGPDGNIWAAEETAESIVRVSPSGEIVGRIPVGGEPAFVAAGPGGRVWATLPESHKLVWFDALAPSPTAHDISTGGGCEPIAIVSGGNGFMYFSKPSDGLCTSEIGRVKDDGTGPVESFATFGATPVGQAFDLLVYSGKLFVPDFGADVVQRVDLSGLSMEAVINLPVGGGPQGIAADGAGNVWVALFSSGKLAYAPAGAASGTNATALTPTGGSLVEPFGIAAGSDGKMYVPSANSQLLAATTLPSFAFSPLPAGSTPFEITNGANGDLWVTDEAGTRLFHLYNPPAPSPAPAPTAAPVATVKPAPKLSLSGKSKQKLGNVVQLKVSCTVTPCNASATGALKIKPGGKGATTQPKLTAAKSTAVPAGKSIVLKLKIPAKAREAAAKALDEKGGKVTAKITVKGKAGSNNTPTTFFKVTLKK
jgi:streptogramin lyase